MNTLFHDCRFAFRMMRKSPGFTVVAVLVLALGIGGTAAMFTIINTLVWRPLAAKDPDQLVRVFSKEKKPKGDYRSFSYSDYAEMREKNTAFSELTAFTMSMVGVSEGDLTRRTFANLVSANYFSAFGVQLPSGRGFRPEEEKPGSAIPVVVVSHSYWRRTGADPSLVGKTVRINSRAFTVVGIAPPMFTGSSILFSPEFWIPLGMYESVVNDFMNDQRQRLEDHQHHPLMLMARLKAGISIAAAQAQLAPLAARLAELDPKENKDYTLEVGELSRVSISSNPHHDSNETTTALLMGMSVAVLLIACLNLANMLLARSAARSKEIAIRLSLGAGRFRLIRQLLTEGLVLSVMGGAGGLLLAVWASQLLAGSLAPHVPFLTLVFDPRPDWRILVGTFSVCVFSVLLFALGPAWKLSHLNVTPFLKEQAGDELQGGGRRGLFSLRSLLVIGQLALSLALLTGAGLFARGAIKAARANPGFSFDRLVLVETDASLAGYEEGKGKQIYLQLLDRLRALPGIEAGSFTYMVPFGVFSDECGVEKIAASAGTNAAGTDKTSVSFNIVGTGYFKTLGLPVLRGRDFDATEVAANSTAHVAIIDEPLAQQLWPGADPLGRQVKLSGRSGTVEIVGVVPGLRNELTDKVLQRHVYVPFGQDYRAGVNLFLRLKPTGREAEAAMVRTVRDTIRGFDSNLPVISVQTMRQFHEDGLLLWGVRAIARLFAIFGGLALVLAVTGVYGVNAYVVARRTREIGIRMALGASSGNVVWGVLRQGMFLTAIGVGLGLVLALALGFLLRSIIYESSAIDPVAFTVGPLCLALAAGLATYLPARRAARVEPMFALRCE